MVDSVQCTILTNGSNSFFIESFRSSKIKKYSVYLNNGYLIAPPGVYFSGDFSISTWIKVKSIQFYSRILDFGNGALPYNVILSFSEDNSNKPFVQILSQTQLMSRLTSNTPIILNEWTHMMTVLNGTNLKLFINNTLVASSNQSDIPSNVTRTSNYIGRSNWLLDKLADAVIGNLRIFNRALSQLEMLKLFENNKNMS